MIVPAHTQSRVNGDVGKPSWNLRRLWQRNRVLLVLAPLLTLVSALLFIRLITPVYEGATTVRISKDKSNLAVLDALSELSTGSEIKTEIAELRSRSLAENVVEALSLNVRTRPARTPRSEMLADIRTTRDAPDSTYRLVRTANGAYRLEGDGAEYRAGQSVSLPGVQFRLAESISENEAVTIEVERFPFAVRRLMKKSAVGQPDREASVISVRYEDTDTELSQAVPNEFARQFIERRDSVRKTVSRSTVGFLIDQIDTIGAQLRVAESGLQAFRERERVVSPAAEAESEITQLAKVKAERDMVDADRLAILRIMNEIDRAPVERNNSPYRRLLGYPTLLLVPAVSELLGSLTQLENERSALLRGRTNSDPDVVLLSRRIESLDNELHALTITFVQGLNNKVAELDGVLSRFSGQLATLPAKEIRLAQLTRQFRVNESIFTQLQTRLKEAQIGAAVADPSVRVMDVAIPPLEPIRPNVPLSLITALMLGLALGIGIAIAREHLDNTIRNRDELQEMSGTVPVLGQVPRIVLRPERRRLGFLRAVPNGSSRNGVPSAAGRQTHGVVAEAYRALRTNIAFTQRDIPAKVIVITSALPGEGKSTSASNLAITLAQQGLRVALLDADMRRGTLHESFGGPQEPGLSNVLLGSFTPTKVLQSIVTDGVEFQFMPTGTRPPNPAELLSSSRVTQLLTDLRADFDAIVIDSPPLNLVADAAILGSRVDGVLLVARSGVTERSAYRHALGQLEAAHARILGCVLNDVDNNTHGYYGAYGAKTYAAAPPIRPS